MQRVFLSSILLLTISLATCGQKQKLDALQQCQTAWKYKDLEEGFSGTIIFFDQPAVMCGVVSTASVALIKKENGDTVRVLTMCNIKKDFNTPPNLKTGERVIVTSSQKPSFRVDIMPVDFARLSNKDSILWDNPKS